MLDKQNKDKYNFFIQSLKDNKIEGVIENIYRDELNEAFNGILNTPEKDFFTMINQKATYALSELYSSQCLFNPIVKEQLTLSEEKLRENTYKLITLAFRKDLREGDLLKTFVKHCSNTECYALHSCGRKLIQIMLFDRTVYYCPDCRMPYQEDLLHLYCTYCNVTYYSNICDEFEIQPATWLNYHCGATVNEKMRCVKCNSSFYLDAKRNMLFCIRCNFEIEPLKIFWKCIICEEEFKSMAKFYNANEFRMLKNATKNALILKSKARPLKVPCCSIDRVEDYIFTHKKECDGFLYKTTLNGKTLVICEKCKTMNHYEKFIWTCPRCTKRFRMKYGSGESDRTPSKERVPLSTQESECKPFDTSEVLRPLARNSGLIRMLSKDNITPVKVANERERDISRERPKIPVSNRGSECKLIEDLRRTPIREEKSEKSPVRRVIYKSENKYFAPVIQRAITPNIKVAIKKLNDYNNELNKALHFSDDEGFDKKKKGTKDSRTTSESDTSMDATPLYSFNKSEYKVLGKIGEGSYGQIYSVIDKNGKTFAMKKIIAHSKRELHQFTKEYELVHSCQHKHIVKLLGVCNTTLDSTTHALYILMEQAETDWEKEITTRGQTKTYYKEEELINVLRILVAALAFLQRKKISHRDIKPQNILVYPGEDFKLADFGEAKKLSSDLNTLRGTEIYMSPILFHGLRNKSADVVHNTYKSDVFSLGLCVLFAATLNFRCLVDIREITNMKVLLNIVNRYLRDRYSSKFYAILRKMLELEEKLRIDFIELERELKEY
jgi:hypothetical protein